MLVLLLILVSFLISLSPKETLTNTKGHDESSPKRYVFSFTTSPSRVSKIKPFLDTLFSQTIPPYKIYANLPYVFKRNNSTFESLPDFLHHPDIVNNWCNDIGPATKIVPTAKRLQDEDPDAYIISVDDDVMYSPLLAETLLDRANVFPNTVITCASFIRDARGSTGFDDKSFYAQLLEGFSGVLYKAKFLSDLNTYIFNTIPKSCYLGDDLTLSNHIRSKNIPIVSLETRDLVTSLDYGLQSDALHKQPLTTVETGLDSNRANYKQCLKWLKETNNFHFDPQYLPASLYNPSDY